MDAVYAIGSNGSGQLGITHKEDVSVPKPAVFHPDHHPPSRIVKVAAGGNHTLLLTQAGKLYWSGDPASGACGLRPFPNIPVFLEARLAKDQQENEQVGAIALVAATWEASVVVSRDETGKRTKVFAFGIGQKGELGLGELIVRTPSATRIKDFPPSGTEVVDLSACMGHVVAVLDNGDVYGWGNCRKAQIGEPAAVVFAPRKVEGISFKAARAVCAKEATCVFGESGSGNMRVLGSDKWGLVSQAPSAALAWKDVGASWGNFYILGQDGSLTAWGRDDHGQLPPPNLPPIERMAIGSEHVVALTTDGDVLSWGWGEHGNCGPQVDNNDVKGRWNVIASSKLIPPEAKIDNVGAGCATSWICIASR